MHTILKSKPIIERIKSDLSSQVDQLKQQNITPSMKVILVGNFKPSLIYTRNKKKFCESVGAECEIIHLDEQISESDFLNQVESISNDPKVHGCFVQLPLPKHLSHLNVGSLIHHEKDVDGFHSYNVEKLFNGSKGDESLLPCTPKGIVTLLKEYNIDFSGKDVVVIGRSSIVGKPMALLAINHNATATICHSRTKDLKKHTQNADIIISAVGKPRFLDETYINPNGEQIIVDVGINHDEDGKLCGDVNYENVVNRCSAITPVPGGVGPMTILSLVQNLIQAAKKSNS